MRKIPVARASSSWFAVRGVSCHRYLLAVLTLTLSCSASSQESRIEKNVLILDSFSNHIVNTPDSVEPELRSRVPWVVNFEVEYLETRRFDNNEDLERSVAETLKRTYSNQHLDLVIVRYYPALLFALKYRDDLFPGVPIEFWSVDVRSRKFDPKMWSGVTGVTADGSPGPTIDLMMRLHPDASTVAIISGNSGFEKYWLSAVQAELLRRPKKMTEVDLVGLSPDQLMERVATLPPETILLFQEGPPDSVHAPVTTFELLAWIGQRLPTYCIWPQACLDHGGIGGVSYDLNRQASLTAKLAARILSGESPDNIPEVDDTIRTVRVDWRQLRRWNISEAKLPPGSVVLYREPTLWERGRKYALVTIVVIVAQGLWIFALLWQRARKRKAEAVLRESEKRFRVMADTRPSLIWMCDDKGKVIYVNEQRVSFTGSDPHAGYGDTWRAFVHPDDVKSILGTFSNALKSRQPFSNRYRLRRRDGVYRWIFDVASPRVNGDGSFAGFIGSAVDVTDQKMAQEALEKVSGQLIEAQEKERTRLARELHDDICQRLTMLSMKIEKATNGVRRGQRSVADQLELIWQQCSDLTGDVQALSHELHPSILDNLGLATAVKSFCREVSEHNGVVVEFAGRDIPNSLPREISLSLFRVIQEAIHNALKYSGGKQFEVRLQAKTREIELEVSDRGAGFDPTSIKNGGGLGLVSMAERIHQVDGTFTIDSQLNIGTRIRARVPLPAVMACTMTTSSHRIAIH